MATRWTSPRDRTATGWAARSLRPRRRIRSSARGPRSSVGTLYSVPQNSRFSRTVRCEYKCEWWRIEPMARRPPSTWARPDCGRMSPASTFRSVVFPAPFGPNTARVCPTSSRKEMPSRAWTGGEPKEWARPSADSIYARAELAQIEWLDQIAAVPEVQDAHERLHADGGGRHDDWQVAVALPDRLEQRDPVGVRDPKVTHEHGGGYGDGLTQRPCTGARAA